MRRIYLFFIAICTMVQTTSLFAQENVTGMFTEGMGYIPSYFTTEKKPYIFTCNQESNSTDRIKIYKKGFDVLSEFVIDKNIVTSKYIIEERESVVGVIMRDWYSSYDIVSEYEKMTPSMPKINRDTLSLDYQYHIWGFTLYNKEHYYAYDYEFKTNSDSGAIYYPKYYNTIQDTAFYFNPSKYGSKYPKYIVRLNVGKNKYLCCHGRSYEEGNRYTGDWTRREEISGTYERDIFSAEFVNVDDSENMDEFTFTQTLFNTDEQFEHLSPVFDEQLHLSYEEDRDYDGIIDYKKYYTSNYNVKGYNIYSNGINVGYLDLPIRISNFFVFGGDMYVAGYYEDENFDECRSIYRINTATNSVEQIAEAAPIKISANRNLVNIEFKEPIGNDCELIITTADGRICKKALISSGSESVKYDTRDLAKGIYNFTVVQSGKIVENGKIVIR